MSIDLERRFGGLRRLYGDTGYTQIRQACVLVVGIGGVGSWAAEALARSGVARLILIDLDHIAESNINRQIHALTDTLGQSKTEAMRQRVAQIHPECQVVSIEEFVEPDHWPELLYSVVAQDLAIDAVIDCCDQVKAKAALAAWGLSWSSQTPHTQQAPLMVCVGAAGGKQKAHQAQVADLSEVTHDPLLAQLRYRLRHEHHAPHKGKMGLSCVFSKEQVLKPGDAAANDLNCHGYGSSVSVTASFGMIAAGLVLEGLAKQPKKLLE